MNKDVLLQAVSEIDDQCWEMLKEADPGSYIEDRIKHLMEVVQDLETEVDSYV